MDKKPPIDYWENLRLKDKLDELERKYEGMVRTGNILGFQEAAGNLDHFLKGSGEKKLVDYEWLRDFSSFSEAENHNQQQFENYLTTIASGLKDGESKTIAINSDSGFSKTFTANPFTELYYASGRSTIDTTGNVVVTRIGNSITFQGEVNHHWYDTYHWTNRVGAFLPVYGYIPDDDGQLLQQHRGAMSFPMESDRGMIVGGKTNIDDSGRLFNQSFNWEDDRN